MADLYRVKDWAVHFENNRTRELKNLTWIPIPNKMDGDGYTQLMGHENGAWHFAAWVMIVEIASRCDPRGTLLRGGKKAHNFGSLSRISRAPEKLYREAIPRLIEIGWLECIELDGSELQNPPQEDATSTQESAESPHDPALKGREGKGRERKKGKKDSGAPKTTRRGHDTWLTPFAELWKERYGGEMAMGEASNWLRPLVDEHGSPEVQIRFENYINETDGQYATFQKFGSTFGEWSVARVVERWEEAGKKRRPGFQGKRHP